MWNPRGFFVEREPEREGESRGNIVEWAAQEENPFPNRTIQMIKREQGEARKIQQAVEADRRSVETSIVGNQDEWEGRFHLGEPGASARSLDDEMAA